MKNLKRFKIVIVGNCHIGKTSLAMQYVNKQFSNVFRSTIGCSFFSKSVQINNKHCQLDIWDTAGQERYRALLPMYYRDAQIIFLCFSLVNTTTLDISNTIEYWVHEIDKHVDYKERVVCLVGTKSDLSTEEETDSIRSYLQTQYPNYSYFTTSAKNNEGVDFAFTSAIEAALVRNQAILDGTFDDNTDASTPVEIVDEEKSSSEPKSFFQKLCTIL